MIEVLDPLAPPEEKTGDEFFSFDIFPPRVWILHDAKVNKYGAYCCNSPSVYPGEIHCLACFRDEDAADQFGALLDSCTVIPKQVSFDEAREVAIQHPIFTALALMNGLEADPKLHFVKGDGDSKNET